MKLMKILSVLVIVAIAGCHLIGGSASGKGAGTPAKVQLSGARGLFLQASSKGAAIRSARTASGRSLVSATGASLGQITASGQPQTASFTDDTGATVTVTISQAVQLTTQYILIAYSYTGGSGIAALNINSGALASINPSPDNWALIYASGASAWYESGGGIWACNLASGTCTEVSAGSETWDTNTWKQVGSAPWASNCWIYVDSIGNIFLLAAANSAANQAVVVTSVGSTDFGNSLSAWQFWNDLPQGASADAHYWAVIDPATGALYLLQNYDDYTHMNGSFPGVGIETLLVTLNPSTPGVITVGTTAIATSLVSASVYGSTNIGQSTSMSGTIFSNGPQSWTVGSGGTLISYDTSSVPIVNNGIIGQVLNWQYVGGNIYAGPAAGNNSISLVQFGAPPSVSDPVLVTDAGITSWTVVGGVLFYTDATGTYQAVVNTASATIATPTLYAGGPVQGITQ